MILLLMITFVNCLIAFANEISKPIKSFLLRPSPEKNQIMEDIAALKRSLSNISLKNEYIEYVKVERKINALEQVLCRMNMNSAGRTIFINYGVGWGMRAVLSILLIIVSIVFRYSPVIVFGDKFNFSPFGGLISYPTGVSGGISVPFWILVSNFTCRTFAGSLKFQN